MNEPSTTDGIRDELVAVSAIFQDNVLVLETSRIILQFPHPLRQPSVRVQITLPPGYPAHTPPCVQVTSLALPTDAIVQKLNSLWVPGEDVLYEWLTFVADESEALVRQAPTDSNSNLNPSRREDAAEPSSSGRPEYPPCSVEIFHGEIVEVKKSKFQAHVCRIKTFEDVKEVGTDVRCCSPPNPTLSLSPDSSLVRQVMDALLGNSKVQQASHNMMAYRLPNRDDFDDDGEAQAGKRMLHMLQMMNVSETMVVVSRWFGGTLLGPARFGIINNVAKDAITRLLPA